MLSKAICKKCYARFPKDERWDYTWTGMDTRQWRENRSVVCPPFGDSISVVCVDEPPKEHCPFALEHYLEAEGSQ